MKPGVIERREHSYIRHGTLCLTPNFDVATGQIIAPTIGPTRTEQDFTEHIKQTVAIDPSAEWIFVVDQLNTHKSKSLVELIANFCDINTDLGVKGKSGVLKSMKSRMLFLEKKFHRIRFVYTPKHCSWLNQVEIWFSILAKRLIHRGNFTSIDELQQKLGEFIEYFNCTLAKPYRWTYTGKPLCVA